jgi:hypothetical protein
MANFPSYFTGVFAGANPHVTNTYDLGTILLNWKDLWLSGNIYIDGAIFNSSGSTLSHNTGTRNYFAGVSSGNPSLTTATDNVGLGFESLDKITTGIGNTCGGSGTGKELLTGDYNTFFGGNTATNTYSDLNYGTAIGGNVNIGATVGGIFSTLGYGHTVTAGSGANLTLIGNSLISGCSNNIGITGSLDFLTYGNCVGIGYGISIANASTTIGTSATTSGATATAIGMLSNAGLNGTSAGYDANATGDQASAFGRGANATGIYGPATGFDSLALDYGCAFGALAYNLAGSRGCCFGYNAAITAGVGGIAIGYSALVTANDGIAIGNDADANIRSISIGAGASSTGGDNVVIGYSASGSSVYAISIGYSASGSGIAIGASSNSSVSTNMVFGQGASGIGVSNAVVFGSTTVGSYNFYFGRGVAQNGTSFTQTFNITPKSGTNSTGNSQRFNSGQSTGNAVGGSTFFAGSKAGSSGSTLNTLTDIVEINPDYFKLINAGLIVSQYRHTADADLTLTKPEYSTVVFTNLSASRNCNLFSAVGLDGYRLTVVDETDTAGSNTIVLDGNGSETINGATTYTINTNRGRVTIEASNGNWLII